MYIIDRFWKYAEEDRYEEGCLQGTGNLFDVDIRLEAKSKKELLEMARDHFSHVEFDEEDPSILRAQVHENKNGEEPDEAQLILWRQGQYRLWLCDYTGKVYKAISPQAGIKHFSDSDAILYADDSYICVDYETLTATFLFPVAPLEAYQQSFESEEEMDDSMLSWLKNGAELKKGELWNHERCSFCKEWSCDCEEEDDLR